MAPTKDTVVSVRLDVVLHERMAALKARDGIGYAEQIRRALDDFLKGKGFPEKKKPVNVGRARVERLP